MNNGKSGARYSLKLAALLIAFLALSPLWIVALIFLGIFYDDPQLNTRFKDRGPWQ